MNAEELRQFSEKELLARVDQWRDELFRTRLKGYTSETKDNSAKGKLRRDIARAMTVLREKTQKEAAPEDKATAAPVKAPKKSSSDKVEAKAETE